MIQKEEVNGQQHQDERVETNPIAERCAGESSLDATAFEQMSKSALKTIRIEANQR